MNCLERLVPYSCVIRPSEVDREMGVAFADLDERLSRVAREKSKEIEIYLEECKRQETKLMKILLLGGPASGKSTLFKQMRIIHLDGFTRLDELDYYRSLISGNVYMIFQQLSSACRLLEIPLDADDTALCETIQGLFQASIAQNFGHPVLSPELVQLLQRFWHSAPIQIAHERRLQFELLDSAKYFCDNLDRLGLPDYLPSHEDIVHSRAPTTAITATSFVYNNVTLRLVDVGGQKSQRRKWIHLFDDVRVVLFIVDMTGCAKQTHEEKEVNDMRNALKIFRGLAKNRVVKEAMLLLFLNKLDLFQEIIQRFDLQLCFPSYQGGTDTPKAMAFIRQQFTDAASQRPSVFSHFTTATNTENVKVVFNACMESVFKQSTRATGLA